MPIQVQHEIRAIPEMGKDGSSKIGLKNYINETLNARHNARTTATFGFYVESPGQQPNPPFGHGTFQSDSDREWYSREETQQALRDKPMRPSGLTANEADASLAVRARNSSILTADERSLLARAAEQGGRFVFLS